MIRTVRGAVRLVFFLFVTSMVIIFLLIGNLILKVIFSKKQLKWKYQVIKVWANLIRLLLNIEVEMKGTPPKPPFFMAGNHLSYIDIIPLWLFSDTTFVAKSDISSWPVIGRVSHLIGIIFINRNMKRDVYRVNRLITQSIGDCQGVTVFPEGTSTKGKVVKPFHSSLLQYPVKKNMEVHYFSLSYKSKDPNRSAANYICWWGDMEFVSHFWELLKLSGFKATIRFGKKTVTGNDRKQMASRLWRNIQNDFIPVVKREVQKEVI